MSIEIGSLYEKISQELNSYISSKMNGSMEILRRMGSGLSGAEVYLVYIHSAQLMGEYFLKIEIRAANKKPILDGLLFPFAPPVKPFAPLTLETLGIFLYRPAGGSCNEYISVRDKRPSSDVLGKITGKHLDLCQKIDKSIIPGLVSPALVLAGMLSAKLSGERELARFLADNLPGDPVHAIGIDFMGVVIPNPYAFTLDNSAWKDFTVINGSCQCHGDMHGQNLLYRAESDKWDYCLIDVDSKFCRNDACLFYDTAYLEAAELLCYASREPETCWLEDMQGLAFGKFDSLEFKGLSLSRAIHDAESEWIEKSCANDLSMHDPLHRARLLARVVAGLNFAGKRKVEPELRSRAFLYAAAFLEKLLLDAKIDDWRDNPVSWMPGRRDRVNREAEKLAEATENFDPSQSLILVCGKGCNEAQAECLARIPWHSIFCFAHDTKDNLLFDVIGRYNKVTSFYKGETEADMVAPSWVFAIGHAGHPDTICNNFAQYNRNGQDFLKYMFRKCHAATNWRDSLVIIDSDSLDDKFVEEIIRLCHSCAFPAVAVIGKK